MTSASPGSSIVEQAIFRWQIYRIIILVSLALMVGKIFAVQSSQGTTPFLSANDRSRWATIRALGDEQTYVIDDVIWDEEQGKFDPEWNSIDKVLHRGADGELRYYSSKPTLLTTMLSCEYVFFKWLTGWTLADSTFAMGRLILIVTNALPLAFSLFLLAKILERHARRPWTRIVVMFCAAFGTFLTTYAVTLNNHLPAAISVLISTYSLLGIWYDRKKQTGYYFLAGLAAAFAAANELPALSFFAAALFAATLKSPKQTLLGFVPAALIVAAGFFGTNYLAHQTWKPAYAHRSDGEVITEMEFDMSAALEDGEIPEEIRQTLDKRLIETRESLSKEAEVVPALLAGPNEERRWELWDPDGNERYAIVERLPNQVYELREWGNWYEYDASYWIPGRKGEIDKGEPSRGWYIFHMSFGHHGFFSLTPIWLFSLVGMLVGLRNRKNKLKWLGLMTLALFVVCFAFYAARPLADRNYGGVTTGLRWLFWFTPLFLICLIPAFDRFSESRWFRNVVEIFLAIGVFSATFAPLNPWTHPWIYQLLAWVQSSV